MKTLSPMNIIILILITKNCQPNGHNFLITDKMTRGVIIVKTQNL